MDYDRESYRKKSHQVVCRMSDEAYMHFLACVQASGMTQQAFLEAAIDGALLATPEDTEAILKLKKDLDTLLVVMRGIGTNLNQLAHIANASGAIVDETYLRDLAEKIADERREAYGVWQCLNALIAKRKRPDTEEVPPYTA